MLKRSPANRLKLSVGTGWGHSSEPCKNTTYFASQEIPGEELKLSEPVRLFSTYGPVPIRHLFQLSE